MTIVILIILATISINAVMGEDGLIKRAEKASKMHANGVASEQDAIDTLLEEYSNALAGIEGNGGSGETPDDTTTPTGPNGKPLTSTVTSTEHTGTEAEDTLGNPVHIPGGFKIAEDSGETVKEGIVVEDASGNQFVWIPVSNINHDGSNLIKVDENTEVEITLGRYTFARTKNDETGLYEDGTPTKVQYGSEYAETTLSAVTAGTVTSYKAGSYFYELTDVRESNGSSGTDGTNTTAKDLKGFVESVRDNHGYYLARYEASYASGSTFGVGNDETYYKSASKVSTKATEDEWTPSTAEDSSTVGYLWNYITQGNASKVCRQMYYGNSYVESDLVNSYAWDTAIVYIQAMGNSNYANAYDGNGTLHNTGDTTINDEKCKIFDMAGNCYEWTTEYSTNTSSFNAHPCTTGGGCYVVTFGYTSSRDGYFLATSSSEGISFRAVLYVK